MLAGEFANAGRFDASFVNRLSRLGGRKPAGKTKKNSAAKKRDELPTWQIHDFAAVVAFGRCLPGNVAKPNRVTE